MSGPYSSGRRCAAALAAGCLAAAVALVPSTSGSAAPSSQPSSVAATSALAVIKTIGVGSFPWGVAVNDFDDTVYVTNLMDNDVSVIDGRTFTALPSRVAVGVNPWGVAVNQSDDTVYVGNINDDNVSVINGRTNSTVGAPITVGDSPRGVAVNQEDGTVYVTNGGSSNSVSEINGLTNATSQIGAGTNPGGVAVDDVDDTIYVANYVDNDMSVIDGRTFAALPSRVAVGNGPDKVAVNQEDDTVYVTNSNDGTVSVINGRTNTLDDTITVGAEPRGVAIDQADDTVYVAVREGGSQGAGFVSVINGRTNTLDDTIKVEIPYAVAVDNAGTNAGLVYVTGGFLSPVLSAVARVSPSLGSLYGAADDTATITLTVPNLAAGFAMDDSTITSVSFDDTLATNLTAGAGNTWTLTVPAGTGTVSVTVTFDGGLEASAGNFTYGSPPAPNPPSPNPPAPTPASAPLDVTATAGDASATVTWKAPASPGDYPVTSYRATASPGGRTCLVTAPVLRCEVTGLTNGAAYTFSVQALTGAGWGAASSPSNAVTPRAVPKPAITITGTRDGQRIVVSGTATDLAGKTLRPWVRFPGQTTYTEGTAAITPAADGSFTWSRKTGKKTYVYIAHGETKSNTVSIPAR